MKFETIAIHAGERPDSKYGAVSVPIYQTSTFVFEDVGKTRGGYDYSRTANPQERFWRILLPSSRAGRPGLPLPPVWPPKPQSSICLRPVTT